MEYILVFAAGLVLGALIVFIISQLSSAKMRREIEQVNQQAIENASIQLMRFNQSQAQISGNELNHKKELIDKTLENMHSKLERVEKSLNDFNEKREVSFTAISEQLKTAAAKTDKLTDTTLHLKEVLSSSKSRGQWGERMAEDVLRLAGFCEGINYFKQKTQESNFRRPDYTFKLPQGLVVNMDVKFPFENYLQYENCSEPFQKEEYKKRFLKDVRNLIKEVTGREYINPAENTVDYAIVFIPNEQIYSFVNQHDQALMDDAMRMKIVVCSPQTLYAVLAVIRQAVDNFQMSTRLSDVLSLIEEFKKQWYNYSAKMDKMGKRLEEAKSEYDDLVGTRSRALDRAFSKIERVKEDSNLDIENSNYLLPS